MAKADKPLTPRQYWDACVFGAYINNEPDRADTVGALLGQCRDGHIEIITSHLSLTEVAYAKTEREQSALSAEQLERIDSLWNPPSKIKLVEYHELVAMEARALIRGSIPRGWSLKPMDAMHLASARRAHLASPLTAVFTYDPVLARFKAEVGCDICAPFRVEPPRPENLFSLPEGLPDAPNT